MKKLLTQIAIAVLILVIAGVVAITRPWQYLANLPIVGTGAALTVNTPQGKGEVYLDDKKIGETPYSSEDLKPGDHKLEIMRISESSDFYTTITRQVHLEANTRTFVEAEIGPSEQFSSIKLIYYRKGSSHEKSVYISSSPSDATVTIDDVRHGQTPVTNKNLEPGKHNLVVTNPGYEDAETVIIVREGYTLIAEIDLMAKPIELESQ